MTTLTMKEEKRLEVIQRVFRAELTMGKASLVLGVSERQCYRIKARVKKQGVKGVVHGNRGRPCKRKVKEKEAKRIVELAKGKYRGFNDHHLTEKLREQEEIELSRERSAGFFVLTGFYLPERNVRPSIAAEEREKRPRG
jgi:transposase